MTKLMNHLFKLIAYVFAVKFIIDMYCAFTGMLYTFGVLLADLICGFLSVFFYALTNKNNNNMEE